MKTGQKLPDFPFIMFLKGGETMERLIVIYAEAEGNTFLQLVLIAVVLDTIFGVLRAIKERKFNSNFGINGAIRKVGMLV